MNQMNDLSFMDRLPLETIFRREDEAMRETFRQSIKHLHDRAEATLDYAGKMSRARSDISDELDEMEVLADTFKLMVMVYRRQAAE